MMKPFSFWQICRSVYLLSNKVHITYNWQHFLSRNLYITIVWFPLICIAQLTYHSHTFDKYMGISYYTFLHKHLTHTQSKHLALGSTLHSSSCISHHIISLSIHVHRHHRLCPGSIWCSGPGISDGNTVPCIHLCNDNMCHPVVNITMMNNVLGSVSDSLCPTCHQDSLKQTNKLINKTEKHR